jgi:hypothetical protein
MRRGDTFASVETQVIDASGLSDAEKAALWLYGWSFVNFRRQRREAIAHIDVLAATPTSAKLPDRRLRLVQPIPMTPTNSPQRPEMGFTPG